VTGGDITHQAFCEGLGQALGSSLMTLDGRGGLEVIQGRTPGANLQLGGHCDRHGDRVDVVYTIDNPVTHQRVRGDRVSETAGSSLAIQRRLIESVVRQLGLPADLPTAVTERPANAAAFDAYLAGRRSLLDYDRPENIAQAIDAFKRALAIDATFASAQAGLGEAYRRQYEATRELAWIESGRQACQAAVAIQPGLAVARVCLGDLDNVAGRYEDALGEFRRALAAEPASDDAHRGAAYALERLGRVDEAEQTYRAAIRLRPEYWAGYSWLATFLHRQGRYAEAAEQFGFALALSPENVRVRRSRGAIYVLMGRFEEGIADFEAANAVRPTMEGFINLGLAYFTFHMFRESITALEEASRRGPQDFSLLANLGDAYHAVPDQQAKAADIYRRALEQGARELGTDPRNAWIHVRLASVYAALADRSHALDHLRTGIALAHDDNESAFFVAVAFARLGDADRTFEWLHKAIAGGYSRAEIRLRVDFERWHNDPRFTALVASK